ncbi:hypothetical protein BJ742DRAFT_741090 [Cladochytrium replicatum]|nr:hypothetical protein BJ742DRAFT_741090 [Cladochytrium replicatum]
MTVEGKREIRSADNHPAENQGFDYRNSTDIHRYGYTFDASVCDNEDNIFDQLNALLRPVVFMGDDTWVDYCAHTWGLDHPAMSAKLSKMNTVLSDIINAIDDKTLLIVVRNHGMDPQGNHGSDSEDEVNSSQCQRFTMFLEMVETKMEDVDPRKPENHRTVPQIALVPTMSLLLGIPIPDGNLGTIIPELFWLPQSSLNRGSFEFEMDVLEKLTWEADEFAGQAFADLEPLNAEPHTVLEELSRAGTAHIYFTRITIAKARRVLAQFDRVLMGAGAIVLALSLLASLALVSSSPWASIQEAPVLSAFQFVDSGSIIQSLNRSIDSTFTSVHEAFFFAAIGSACRTWSGRSENHRAVLSSSKAFSEAKWRLSDIQNACNWGDTLLVLPATSPPSDSCTKWEEPTIVLILQTFGFLSLIRGLLTFPSHVADPIDNDKESNKPGRRPAFSIHTAFSSVPPRNGTLLRSHYNPSPSKTYASKFATMILVFDPYGKLDETIASPVVLSAGLVYWEQNSLEGHNIRAGDLASRSRQDLVGQDSVPGSKHQTNWRTIVSLLFVQLVLALDLFIELRLEERRVKVKHELSEHKAALNPTTTVNIGETIKRRILQQRQQSEKQLPKPDTSLDTPSAPIPKPDPVPTLSFLQPLSLPPLPLCNLHLHPHPTPLLRNWPPVYPHLHPMGTRFHRLRQPLASQRPPLNFRIPAPLRAVYIPLLIFWNRPFWVAGGGTVCGAPDCVGWDRTMCGRNCVDGVCGGFQTAFECVERVAPKWMFQAAATGYIDVVEVIVFALVM